LVLYADGLARAVPSFWKMKVLGRFGQDSRATAGTGRAKSLVTLGSIFFIFLIILGQIPTKQIKITQNKQNNNN